MTPMLGDAAQNEETVTKRVVEAVADEENVDATELDPLYYVVDPEALEALVASGIDGHVAFTYHDTRVVVDGDGGVEVGRDVTVSLSSTA